MIAPMKRASSRVISIFALGAALLGGCEDDYDKLSDDLLESGWGEDAAALPACVPGKMDAATPTPDASTGDAAAQDSAVADASNGDGGTAGDGGAPAADAGDASSPEAGSGDGG